MTARLNATYHNKALHKPAGWVAGLNNTNFIHNECALANGADVLTLPMLLLVNE
jgi:hypothetical protein